MPQWTDDEGRCRGCPSGCSSCMPNGVRLLPGGSFVRIGTGPDATTWARHDGEMIEQIRYKLRYTPQFVTTGDMMLAAEALCSYAALVEKPTKRRSAIIRGLKLARTLPPSSPLQSERTTEKK